MLKNLKTIAEVTTENLEEVKTIAQNLLAESEKEESVEKKNDIESDLEQVINYYRYLSKDAMMKEAVESGDPMKYAINTYFYPIIRVKETKDKTTKETVRSIVDAGASIDLGELNTKLHGIGHDPNWIFMVEKFNFYLTVRAAKRVGATIDSDAYILKDISRQIDLGKNPVSNTNLLKTLQTIVTAMLGDGYKALSHDVNYLVDCYASDNKKTKNSIKLADHKTLRTYMKKVCYRILNNQKGYIAESKEIKTK